MSTLEKLFEQAFIAAGKKGSKETSRKRESWESKLRHMTAEAEDGKLVIRKIFEKEGVYRHLLDSLDRLRAHGYTRLSAWEIGGGAKYFRK